jgi:ATP-dependent Lhr-like helicase
MNLLVAISEFEALADRIRKYPTETNHTPRRDGESFPMTQPVPKARRRPTRPAATAASGIDRVRAWFNASGWTPWPFQEEVWQAYLQGRSGLLQVATGAGKTYASFMGALAEAIDDHASKLSPQTKGLRVLYITPLRAVSRDIELALKRPIRELDLPLRVESRTGDTKSSIRSRQGKNLPEVLVTTPESLTLLLSREGAREQFANVRACIVDEWHELLSSKRGTQTELALAHLRTLAPRMRTWALSATLDNLDEAARAAVGTTAEPLVVRGHMPRPVVITTLLPKDGRLPWAGHFGLAMLPAVLDWIDPNTSTLVFVNTRAQAELWYQALLHSRPDWEPIMGLHHGSIDRAARERLELGLKSGDVKLVVATSSLDLGVDFAPVERVMQIGAIKGVARLMQRAGRAAHRPGATCEIVCVPTYALELVEIAAARNAIARGEIEPRRPMPKPLDVLTQHLVTCSLGEGFEPDALFDEVRGSYSYRDLTREEFDWCLRLVEHGGETLKAYPEHHRVRTENNRYVVSTPAFGRLHRLNVGTITGEATMDIRFYSGRRLGTIEEYFVSSLRPGDKFVFAARVLEFIGIRDGAAIVRAASGKTNFTPHWAGTRLPMSESLAGSVRLTLERCHDGHYESKELEAARPIIEAQQALSSVPSHDQLLIELTTTRDGHHAFLYPFDGRLVHSGIAALLALRLSRLVRTTFSISSNDYGFELLTGDNLPFEELITPDLFSSESLAEDVLESVNLSELAKVQFREVARVSGLVFQTYPGARKSGRQVLSSAGLMYDVFCEFDPGNLLLEQARREVLQRQFEQSRLVRTLDRLEQGRFLFRRMPRPSPLGFPLVIERLGGRLSSETILDRVEKMKQQWLSDTASISPAASKPGSRAKRSS